jgi:hypothetical protein
MALIPTFLFTESLISLIGTFLFFSEKYFLTVLNTTVIIEILRINTSVSAKCVRSSTVEGIPTLLYGIEVSYYSLIVCDLNI